MISNWLLRVAGRRRGDISNAAKRRSQSPSQNVARARRPSLRKSEGDVAAETCQGRLAHASWSVADSRFGKLFSKPPSRRPNIQELLPASSLRCKVCRRQLPFPSAVPTSSPTLHPDRGCPRLGHSAFCSWNTSSSAAPGKRDHHLEF